MKYYISYIANDNELYFKIGSFEQLEKEIKILENSYFQIIDYPTLFNSLFIREEVTRLEHYLNRQKLFLTKALIREKILNDFNH